MPEIETDDVETEDVDGHDELIDLLDEGGLSRGEARAYVVRKVQGMRRQEAAEYLGIAPTTVDTLYDRARGKIKAIEEALGQIRSS